MPRSRASSAGRIETSRRDGILMVMAEFERELMSERTVASIAAAKQQGRHVGRPAQADGSQARLCKALDRGQQGKPRRGRCLTPRPYQDPAAGAARVKNLLLWFKFFLNWLLIQPRRFWWGTLVTLIVLWLAFWWRSEQSFRFAGGGFQLLGVYTVVRGLNETRKLFGHPGLLARLRQWLHRVPRFPRTIMVTGQALVGDAFASAQASVWRNAGPGDSLETRVTTLEKNLSEVNRRLNDLITQNIEQHSKLHDRIALEETRKMQAIKTLSDNPPKLADCICHYLVPFGFGLA